MRKWKKSLSFVLAALFVFTTVFAVSYKRADAADSGVTVYVNGSQVSFDVPPDIISDRVMVPLRAIGEILGASVNWIDEMQKVVIILGTKSVDMTVGSPYMTIADTSSAAVASGNPVSAAKLDAVPVNISGRVLVPVRAISQAFGATVNWDPDTKRVDIITANAPAPTQAPTATPAPTQAPTAVPTATPSPTPTGLNAAFDKTDLFQITTGTRIQYMHQNTDTQPFVMLWFDSSTQAAVDAMAAINAGAALVQTQVFGLDIKTSTGITTDIGSWLWDYVSKADASNPVLIFCYADGTICAVNDLSSADNVTKAFRYWAGNTLIPSATPSPTASPSANPSAAPSGAAFDITTVDGYSTYVRQVSAATAQTMCNSGQTFMLIYFDSSKDPSTFVNGLSTGFKAALQAQQAAVVVDGANTNMDDAPFIKSFYGTLSAIPNPTMMYVANLAVISVTDLSTISVDGLADMMNEFMQNN